MAMKIKSTHIVKPAEQTWNGTLPLSELDQIAIITLSSHLYFYDKPTQEDWLNPQNNKILNTLKHSLSQVLVPFYPLAGRLSWIPGGRLKLECNAMGAELIEVESTMKITDFGDFYSSSENFQHLLPRIEYYEKPIQDLPVLAVQVTRFACGGLSVGISMSHVVVDGKSAFHFTEEWARLARGEPLEFVPFLDRRVLQAEDHVSGSRMTENIAAENMDFFSQLRYFGEVDNLEWGKQVTPTFVYLTKDKIERLKEVANITKELMNDNGVRPYSRFEVITAHIWRCVTKARELKDEDITTLIACVDARGRMEPPLPPRYFGNAIIDIEISSCVRELISKPLRYACSKIREATTKVNKEYVLETIEFYKNQKSVSKYQYIDDRGKIRGPSYGDQNVLVMSWLNLMGRSIDFGWGKEIHMGPPIVYAGDGDFMITPYKDDGSVVVGVSLQPKQKFQEYMSYPIE
ncbi:spermidine hydroxycinnamoyl transferase [Beta vulgaris subsp. vulgaris]|uniref:spermidine hydroxycinnamoyl transferase n=1 Tax=Beta vulgaris subsp. vulgaris TaxID=3555 RepID=UPI002036CC76|nr:spermidine hydroxycinnamoyl transferase [Beta vulgaris subsp. vulgaris]